MVPWVCLGCVIVVFPDHTHLFFQFLSMYERIGAWCCGFGQAHWGLDIGLFLLPFSVVVIGEGRQLNKMCSDNVFFFNHKKSK